LYIALYRLFTRHASMNAMSAVSGPEVIRIGQLEIHYLQGAGSGCEMGSFVLVVPPGSNVPPPHSHPGNEELIYVLEGTLRYTVDGVTRDLGPGESMGTPRGSVHGFSNPHGAVARALVINTPDIGAGYFREVAAVARAGGPPDPTKVLEIMRRYGLVPARPGSPLPAS
jgi:quercetin dioxygenase-like cupin family protein